MRVPVLPRAFQFGIALAAVGCTGPGGPDRSFLEPTMPEQPLEGDYVFDAEVPVYGRLGGYEPVHGSVSFTPGRFELTSTHGSCAGELRADQPGRYRLRCQGIELDLRWLGTRWGGRMDVQVVESDEEQVCVQQDPQRGCVQFRMERRERPVRRNTDFALYRPGEAR